jgi:hypothetical protein
VVNLCVQQGLVSGHTQVLDSAYLKANASMSRLQPKRAVADGRRGAAGYGRHHAPTGFTRAFAATSGLQATSWQAAPTKPGQLYSNFTHYSPADPEARIAYKTGKPRQLSYRASVRVDTARSVTTHIQADLADGHDSRHLLPLVDAVRQRLQQVGLVVHQIVADASYSSGENYAQLDNWRLLAFIPPHGKYQAQRPDFTY